MRLFVNQGCEGERIGPDGAELLLLLRADALGVGRASRIGSSRATANIPMHADPPLDRPEATGLGSM
jgi:hypothetical protein